MFFPSVCVFEGLPVFLFFIGSLFIALVQMCTCNGSAQARLSISAGDCSDVEHLSFPFGEAEVRSGMELDLADVPNMSVLSWLRERSCIRVAVRTLLNSRAWMLENTVVSHHLFWWRSVSRLLPIIFICHVNRLHCSEPGVGLQQSHLMGVSLIPKSELVPATYSLHMATKTFAIFFLYVIKFHNGMKGLGQHNG